MKLLVKTPSLLKICKKYNPGLSERIFILVDGVYLTLPSFVH